MGKQPLRIALPALALVLSLACAPARAADLGETCAELIQEKSVVRAGEPSLIKLILRLIFDRGSFVNPLEVGSPEDEAPANPASIEAAPPSSPSSSIRIFTLGHLEPVSAEDRALLNELKKEQKRQLKAVNRLLKSKTAAECMNTATKIGWSPTELDALQSLEDSALQATRHAESQLSMKMAKKAASRGENGEPSWDIVPVDSWGEIIQSLRSHPVSGMILIAHADPNGRLYDSLRDELPSGFFKGLPPSVRFIGIFSCESAQVARAYSLDQLQDRQVVAVKLGAPFDVAETTPIQFFPSWVRKLEFPSPTETQTEAECPLTLDGLRLHEGRLAVTIRGLPAGVWSAANETRAQLIPCSWLAEPARVSIFLEPTQLGEKLDFGEAGLSALADAGGSVISLSHEELYKTDSGQFRSALLSSVVPPL